jgi:hypothetical protein
MSTGARADIAAIPDAIKQAANRHRVPVEVMYSVLLLESGMRKNGAIQPWPWTLNVNHKPYRYESFDEAKAALEQFMRNPKNTIAVGASQIYLPAHGKLFADKTDLLKPDVNLDYAAKLLASEYRETAKRGAPNWWLAAGRYHAPNNKYHSRLYRSIAFTKCRKISAQCTMYGKIS